MNYLKKTIDLLYLIFVREINFIIILFTLNFLPSCLYILLNEPGLKIMTLCTHAALYILFLSYIVAVLKCIFDSNIWKKVIAFTSLALSLFFFISESFLLYRYQSIINRYIIGTIIETNASEAKEYLLQYIDTNYLIILIAILFLFIISVRSFLHIKISLDYRYIKFLFWVYLFFSLIILINRTFISPFQYKTMSPVLRFCNYYKNDIYEHFALKNKLNTPHPNLAVVKENDTPRNIILLVGESLSRNHMSLYGYPIKTTPHQDSLFANKQLYRFTNVVSPSQFTREVMTNIFSFYNSESNKEWYEYPLIMDIFSSADYKTYWISNQRKYSFHDNVASVISDRCDVRLFCEDYIDISSIDIKECYDQAIFPLLDNIDMDNSSNFIVIHLMGSHTSFNTRYPQSFSVFYGNSFYNRDYTNERDEAIMAEYDHSVLYNDYVVNSIYEYFKDTEAVVFYLSDHGEEVYDDRSFCGRGVGDLNPHLVEIPFTIWMSDTFKQKYPFDLKRLSSALQCPYKSDDLIHTILDFSHISTKEFDSTRSLFSDDYNIYRKRIIKGWDYDLNNN